MSLASVPINGGASFAALLRRYRTNANLTQEALAARSGISIDAISMLERSVHKAARKSTVELLAKALSLDETKIDLLATAARFETCLEPTTAAVLYELRTPLTPLIGRDIEVARACSLLRSESARVVTVTGAPGVGKTRLALEVATRLARDFPNGVVKVSLGRLSHPEMLALAIRRALGLSDRGRRPPLETVLAHCRELELLLLLDNFEHLLPSASLLLDLTVACPRLRVLVTSRAPLRIRGEHELPVPTLDLPGSDPRAAQHLEALCRVSSVRLLIDRAQAAAPRFVVSGANAFAVAQVCERLDGLPLAIELAAPWLRVLNAEDLLHRLERRLQMLVGGARDLPPRQQTMRATLDWSYFLLEPEQQALLRRLSVFRGSIPLEAVEKVCQAAGELPHPALDLLVGLVDQSLVGFQDCPERAGLAMLETVREYAGEQLEAAGETRVTVRAHAEHYAPQVAGHG